MLCGHSKSSIDIPYLGMLRTQLHVQYLSILHCEWVVNPIEAAMIDHLCPHWLAPTWHQLGTNPNKLLSLIWTIPTDLSRTHKLSTFGWQWRVGTLEKPLSVSQVADKGLWHSQISKSCVPGFSFLGPRGKSSLVISSVQKKNQNHKKTAI